jgi:hypothetical protein
LLARVAAGVAMVVAGMVAVPTPSQAAGDTFLEISVSVATAQPVAPGSPITFSLNFACSSFTTNCNNVEIDIPRPAGQPGNIPLTISAAWSNPGDPTRLHYSIASYQAGTSTSIDFTITTPPSTPAGTTVTPVATSTSSTAPTRTASATATVGSAATKGQLRVTSSPALPSQILVDGIARDTWGLSWLELAPGTYTVSFAHVEGWTEPAPATVNVTAGAVTTVTGAFTRRGVLQVKTSPAKPGTISVDGIPRDTWGMWTDLPAGTHQVCFGPVAGSTAPPCQSVNLVAGAQTTITGNYT